MRHLQQVVQEQIDFVQAQEARMQPEPVSVLLLREILQAKVRFEVARVQEASRRCYRVR